MQLKKNDYIIKKSRVNTETLEKDIEANKKFVSKYGGKNQTNEESVKQILKDFPELSVERKEAASKLIPRLRLS